MANVDPKDALKNELNAVKEEFLAAVEIILSKAERIESLAEAMDDERAKDIVAEVAEQFLACGFQDITGQRLAKCLNLLSATDVAAPPAHRSEEAALMNGPQRAGDALEQDTVDNLFGDEV